MPDRVSENLRAAGAILLWLAVCPGTWGQEPRLTPGVNPAHAILAAGFPAPDFSLPGVDGKLHQLSDYKDSRLLMVMFICNRSEERRVGKECRSRWSPSPSPQ